MDKVVPLIVFLLVIAEVILKAKKSQAKARGRALMPQRAPPRPTLARRPQARDDDEEDDDTESDASPDEEPEDERARTRSPAAPALKAWTPRPVLRRLVPTAIPVPESTSRKAIRLSPSGLRHAVILTEILGPPVALRE